MDVNIVNAIAIFAILIIATTAIVAMDCNGGRKARDKNWYDGDVRITHSRSWIINSLEITMRIIYIVCMSMG